MYVNLLIAGFGGGAVRGLVGFIKHQFTFKNVQFELKYFLAMTFISGIAGLLIALAVQEAGVSVFGFKNVSPGLSFIIGYAGGDIIENAIKIVTRKPSLIDLFSGSIFFGKFFR
jgi:hypothetical protein